MRKQFTILFGFWLSACAYQPVPQDYKGPTATVADTGFSEDATKAQIFALMAIDGNKIGNAFSASANASYGAGAILTTVFSERSIPIRPIKALIRGSHATGMPAHAMMLQMAGDFLSVEGTVDFTPQAGYMYQVKGMLNPHRKAVWIEDSTGNVVTQVVELVTNPNWKKAIQADEIAQLRKWEIPIAHLSTEVSPPVGLGALACRGGYSFSRDCNLITGPNKQITANGQIYRLAATTDGAVILEGGGLPRTSARYSALGRLIEQTGIAVQQVRPVRVGDNLFGVVILATPGAYDVLLKAATAPSSEHNGVSSSGPIKSAGT